MPSSTPRFAASPQRLGYDRILGLAAQHAVSPLGCEAILGLRPASEVADIERRCNRLAEVWRLAEQHQSRLSLSGLTDIRAALEAIRPAGSVLDAEDLQALAGIAHLIDRVIRFLTAHRDEAPRLAEDLLRLHPCPEIHEEIDRCLLPSGEVADAASPELEHLRRDRRRLESSIRTEIDRLMRDTAITSLLQDSYHTERQGRHVLPLAAGNRGKIPGIVHDRSASGETLFVEPMAIVELTNDTTEARLAERAEVQRILAGLTDLVRGHLEDLEASLETLTDLDALAAIAQWGAHHGFHLPRRDPAEPLCLIQCHHPLLRIHQRETSVPLDLSLGSTDRAVVISGPNAGGKTTALKTVGLVQLMTQAGLPIPADPGSNVPVPRSVHADIGDDQDVETGLSTFTAHMAHIAAICEGASRNDLILLDELGTATDPQEGGALAVAILEMLSQRGCLTIATSHLILLKQWAHETQGAQNASVGLDAATQRPTYRLTLGLPGPSEALTVAGHVGLSEDILARARQLMPEQQQRLSELITDLQERGRHLQDLEADAERLQSRLTIAERDHRDASERAERERKTFRREIAVERRRMLAEAKAEVERRIANLPSKRELLDAKTEIETEIRRTDAEIAEAAQSPIQGGGDFTEGDTVEVLDARETGRIIALDAGRGSARVETSRGMVITVKLDRLASVPSAPGQRPAKRSVTFARRDDVSMELNLIGQRVEPALEALDKFLDEAASHGLDHVRIIHGFGTGALRNAVREFADGHPLVQRWKSAEHSAGGHAVTLMELK